MKLFTASLLLLCLALSQAGPVFRVTYRARLLSLATGLYFGISSSGEVAANSSDVTETSDAWLEMTLHSRGVVVFHSTNYQLLLAVTADNSSTSAPLTLRGIPTTSEDDGSSRMDEEEVASYSEFTLRPSLLDREQRAFRLVINTPDLQCYLKRVAEERYACQVLGEGDELEDSEDTWITYVQGNHK